MEWYGDKESVLEAIQKPKGQDIITVYQERIGQIQEKIANKIGTDVNSFEIRSFIGEYDFAAKQLYQMADVQPLLLEIAKEYKSDSYDLATDTVNSYKLQKEAQDMYKTKSFYRTLANYKIKPTWVNENYSIKDVNNAKIEKLMRIKNGSSTFFVKRLAFDELDNVIEYSETYFNKDWYSVTVNIKEL